jgi:hypothetical protein
MPVSQKEQLMSLLFREDIKPVNLKFFRFGCAAVTEEELCAEFASALKQKRDGTANVTKEFPEHPTPIDVRQIISRQ